MSNYNPQEIEKKWQQHWKDTQAYKVENSSHKPKFYVLDMFPYPSGAGLHVGHPLGYIASDIVSRYKRHKGFSVLHPMGFDSFGLPAEQYAIQTGQHPAITTEQNINRYKEQLNNIGFSYDWDREVQTSDPAYYKWTQWIFCQLFNSWYDKSANKAKSIDELKAIFSKEGNANINAHADETPIFTADEWNAKTETEQYITLLNYRLAYLADQMVNWCPELGTVLANEEVKDGLSERGGYPVFRVNMRQWFLRITAFADRLLNDLDTIDWPEPLKEQQRNWIGRSEGASIEFGVIANSQDGGDISTPSDLTPNNNDHGFPTLSDLSPCPSPQERGAGNNPDEVELDASVYRHTSPELFKALISRAKAMRSNPTEAENLLWDRLRANKQGIKFRRQHIIDKYIVDFVSLSHQLVIEVDGDIHDHQTDEDEARTAKLNELGFEVIRFTNDRVLDNPFNVAKEILEYINTKISTSDETVHHPSPVERGRGRGQNSPLLWKEAGDQLKIQVFSTRPDTIFGATFMVLAPEHELVPLITTEAQKAEVEKYIEYAGKRSERDRMSEVKTVTGCFTGAYAENPMTGDPMPIWIADYVLAGYGTGAVMAVPGHDSRDYAFAKHFGLPIVQVVIDKDFTVTIENESYDAKDGILINSDFLNGLEVSEAKSTIIKELEIDGIGKGKVNYRLRDAGFGRQRYWGEPFPIVYRDGLPYLVDESELPVTLPQVQSYKPTGDGSSPLAAIEEWVNTPNGQRETNTMPGWAGSSWYFLRYMDPKNPNEFASKEAVDYWQNVDLYLGGSEHATGHLLYVRFWTKFLYDIGKIPVTEPAKKLINQGMIQGVSEKRIRLEQREIEFEFKDSLMKINSIRAKNNIHLNKILKEIFSSNNNYYSEKGPIFNISISSDIIDDYTDTNLVYVDVNNVKDHKLIISEYIKSSLTEKNSWNVFICKNGYWLDENYFPINDGPSEFYTVPEIEKMSKSKWNVVNPDDMVSKYGADTLRLYEMFLGPLEQSKPWNTNGIEGVYRFLGKLWRLFFNDKGEFEISDAAPTPEELKILHKTIKKTAEDIEGFSFNTTVSAFMICVNELTQLKCNKRAIMEPLLVCLSPYAPHIAEELWSRLGHTNGILDVEFPVFNPEYLIENTFNYPVSINGKTRVNIDFDLDADEETIKVGVLANEIVQKWVEDKPIKKFILVKGRIINVVV